MKTIDERIQIITQRSRAMVKKKKKRQKLLVATVTPLCLCAILACSWFWPQPSDAVVDGGIYGTAGGLGCVYERAEITMDGKNAVATDQALVTQLYSCISQIEQQPENTPLTIPEKETEESAASVYICFFSAGGATQQYFLSGTALTNKLTGSVNFLSSAQLYRLRTMLREIAYEK